MPLLGDTGLNTIYINTIYFIKQIGKRCRVAKYTHSLVQVAEGCFTNQYIKSTTRSRISIERVVLRCNICSVWSFTYRFNPKTVDSLRYCSNSGSVSTKFYLPAGLETKFLDDEYTIRLYSPNIAKKNLVKLRKQSILNCPIDFIQFLGEFLVNLLRGELRDLRKGDVVKYRKEISELTRKRTPLHKRIFLSST